MKPPASTHWQWPTVDAGVRDDRWARFLGDLKTFASLPQPLQTEGTLVRVTGLVLEATGLRLPVGSVCDVIGTDAQPVQAEVVGFHGDRCFLMPTGEIIGLASGARVVPRPVPQLAPRFGHENRPWRRSEDRGLHLPMGEGLLGRVVDAHGRPLDTGVRAIDTLLTVGRGQRLGLFAGTGVGKSVLLGMMARYTAADVIVVGLIGERGREVKEFIEDILGTEGRQRSVVVAAPADAPPLVRLQGAYYATAIAEHFRDRGRHVLLLMDSLTRFAMAQREIALAIGEPPATKGYPPSVFARLPALVERSGNGTRGQGSITAFYTVLTEGDDPQDPIADAARGILDGHVVLARELAEAGHYPAIDVERSISRVMTAVASREHVVAARLARKLLARASQARDLVQLGAYAPGHDAELDLALRLQPRLAALLQQDMSEGAAAADSVRRLLQTLAA